jgi:hypothetical protein
VIYDNYYAVGNQYDIGIKVIDLKTKKTVDIKDDRKTRKGTMVDFATMIFLKLQMKLNKNWVQLNFLSLYDLSHNVIFISA